LALLLFWTSAMISFTCPKCQAQLHHDDTDAGKKIRCLSCNQKLLVPTPPQLSDKTLLGVLSPPANKTSRLIPAKCPFCEFLGKVRQEFAGKTVKCRICSTSFVVGTSPEEPAPDPTFQPALLEETPPLPVISIIPPAQASPRPPSHVQRAEVQPVAGKIPTSQSSSVSTAFALTGGCVVSAAVAMGSLLVISLLVIVIFSAGDPAPKQVSNQPTAVPFTETAAKPATVPLTEAAARDQLKRALNAWAAGQTPQTLAQQYPSLDFVDPYFTDRAILLRFDIERTQLYSYSGYCEVWTRLVTRRVDGAECRYARAYDVKSPDEKGIWRILVSPVSPSGPGVANTTPPRDTTQPNQRDNPDLNPIPGFQPPPRGNDLPGVCARCRGSGLSDMRCTRCQGTGFGPGGFACSRCQGRRLEPCLGCDGGGKSGGGPGGFKLR
jgi:DNA-directed RNA polymerase subunit RPC12/RpoP